MSDQKTYICKCGNQFCGRAAIQPPGWEWNGSDLLCSDCVTIGGKMRRPPAAEPKPPAKAFSATAIMLRSGYYFDFAYMDCSWVQPEDIAAGLRQPRFSAQTEQIYTIAQHSLLVRALVEPVAEEIGGPKGEALRRCALMHDATEALIHDITRPLKSQLPQYRTIEAQLDERLSRHFGYVWTKERRQIVKLADMQALAIEQRDLVANVHPWPALANINRAALTGIAVETCLTPDEASSRFLDAFHQLFPTFEREAA